MKPRTVTVIAAVVCLLLMGWPASSYAAVSISRAELSGSDLRVEGDRAVANARIFIDGVDRGRADDRGRFRIEVSGFSSPTCRISVDDGTGAVQANLSGCTPSNDDPPPPPPPPTPTPSGVLLNPSSVTAGAASTGTVLLNSPAPTGGTAVSLTSNNISVATVASSVTVPAGDTAASFSVTTHPVASTSFAAISANSGGVTRTATLTVTPSGVTVGSLQLSPEVVPWGDPSEATVTLTGSAPAGGAVVQLSSNNTAVATVPATVTVPAGESTASFAVSTHEVTSARAVTISATYGGVSQTARLVVTADGHTLGSLTLDPALVIGGRTSLGTVTLAEPKANDTVVSLSSTKPALASVQPSVTVPAGAMSAEFTVTTVAVSTVDWAQIIATAGGDTRAATIDVTTASPWTLQSVTLNTPEVIGGGAATGRVIFDRVTDAANVTVESSHPDIVTVSGAGGVPSVVVPQGQSSTTFPVTTAPVSAPVEVTITATHSQSATRTVTLTVLPGDPPPPDRVEIKRAEWKKCVLRIEATSTNPDAILTVHLASSDGLVFRLTDLGGGNFAGERTLRPPGTNVPVEFVVKSHHGGSDRVTLSDPQGFRCRADL